jgi:type IV pilus assembly protein PilC
MPTFEYTVIDLRNAVYRGYVRGWTKSQASKQLDQPGLSIVTLARVRTKFPLWRQLFRRVAKIDKIIFLRNLMTMLRAGLNITEALASSREQSANPYMKRIIAEAEKAVLAGQTLSSALAKHPNIFSPVVVAMIQIGERGGRLVDSLEYLVKQQEGDYQLWRRIRNALVYPLMIIVTMILIIIIMMIFVIPKIAAIYDEAGASLPFYTAALVAISHFVAHNILFLVGGVILFIIVVNSELRSSQRFRKGVHFINLHIPAIGTAIKKLNLAIIARSLHMLARSGFSIDEGLMLVSQAASNVTYQQALRNSIPYVKRGVQLSDIFKGQPEIFLPLFQKMVKTGEETGYLDDMFSHIAKYYDDDLQHWSTNLSTMIEPLLLLITAVVVGSVAFAIIFPLWNFANIL